MAYPDTPFKVIVNDQEPLDILAADARALDIVSTGPLTGHILLNNKAYNYEIVSADFAEKKFDIRINGNRYTIRADDRYSQLIASMGLSADVVHRVKEIKAPMPGLVLDIFVTPGQQVAAGEKLLILEAMKMENVIKAPGDAIVKAIFISKGHSVEKGYIMIEME